MSFVTSVCSYRSPKSNIIIPGVDFLLNEYRVFGFVHVNSIKEDLLTQCFTVFSSWNSDSPSFSFYHTSGCSAFSNDKQNTAKGRVPSSTPVFGAGLMRIPLGNQKTPNKQFSNYINSTESMSNHDYNRALFFLLQGIFLSVYEKSHFWCNVIHHWELMPWKKKFK